MEEAKVDSRVYGCYKVLNEMTHLENGEKIVTYINLKTGPDSDVFKQVLLNE